MKVFLKLSIKYKSLFKLKIKIIKFTLIKKVITSNKLSKVK